MTITKASTNHPPMGGGRIAFASLVPSQFTRASHRWNRNGARPFRSPQVGVYTLAMISFSVVLGHMAASATESTGL